jgi:hypothetical protein
MMISSFGGSSEAVAKEVSDVKWRIGLLESSSDRTGLSLGAEVATLLGFGAFGCINSGFFRI